LTEYNTFHQDRLMPMMVGGWMNQYN